MSSSGPSNDRRQFDETAKTDASDGTEREPALSKEEVIDRHQLTFDPGDKLNGSLYIAEPLNASSRISHEEIISAMRTAQLWSNSDPKQVPEDLRETYKDQLELVDAIRYTTERGEFLIARFDHPKFPSDDGRWCDWQRFFDARYSRIDTAT